jgi:uncharacterized protein YceK
MFRAFTSALLLNTLLLSGCGTYMVRGGSMDWRDDRYYRGTKTSAQLVTGYDMGYARMLTGGCWVMVVCPIIMIGTLPGDIVVDTLLLPYDAFQPERPKRNMHVNMKDHPPVEPLEGVEPLEQPGQPVSATPPQAPVAEQPPAPQPQPQPQPE